MAGAQLAIPTVAGAALAPTVTEETVGTGILDATGREITRQAMKYGPSIVGQFGKRAIPWLVTNAVRYAGWSTGSAILHKAMDWLE